jgi:hypothetical protein
MQSRSFRDASQPVPFWLWVKHKLAERLRAMRPALTAGEVTRVMALSGNPPGA